MQQPAVALAHARARCASRDREVARLQGHVVGDEQWAHADDARARASGARAARPRRARALEHGRDLLAQQLEAAAPHVGEVAPLGPQRRALVEVDRDAQLVPDAPARLVRERDALLDRHPLHGMNGSTSHAPMRGC